MSQSEVTREEFPLHFAIADALGGEVCAFDVYQGPYIMVPNHGRLWIQSVADRPCDDDGSIQVYSDRTQKLSEPFWPYYKEGSEWIAEADAVQAAREVIQP